MCSLPAEGACQGAEQQSPTGCAAVTAGSRALGKQVVFTQVRCPLHPWVPGPAWVLSELQSLCRAVLCLPVIPSAPAASPAAAAPLGFGEGTKARREPSRAGAFATQV